MLFAELIAAIATSLVYMLTSALLLIEALITVIGLVLDVVFSFLFASKSTSDEKSALRNLPGNLGRRHWLRKIGMTAGGFLLATLGLALILNFVFFDWTARKIINAAGKRSGIEIDYASAEGNLLTGRIRLTKVSLVRREHPATVFDLQAKEIAVDLDIWSLFWGDRRVEDARATGVRGNIESRSAGESKPWYVKKNVVIDRIAVADAFVEWRDQTRTLPLAIDEFKGENLHTRWIAFGLLLKTNGAGRIAGKPFKVINEPAGDGERTVWQFSELPVAVLGDYVGGPMRWMKNDTAEVVATTVHGDPTRGLDMDWRFDFRNVRAEVPDSLDGLPRRIGTAFVEYVNTHGEHLPMAFTLQVDSSGFDGTASAEAAGLWSAVADAATQEASRMLKLDPKVVDGWKQEAGERLRALRKRPAE